LGAVAVGTSIGVLVGSAAALTGGVVDRALMRLSEVVLAVPRVLLLLTLVALWQVRSTAALVVVIGVTGWMATSRLVRDELRSALRDDRVLAARALGVPRRRLVQHHLLPAVLPLVAVTMTGAFAQVLLLEAGLSVVGLGVQPPEASWGSVLHDVSDVIGRARWLALGPGAVIMLTALATQRIGDVVQQRLLIPHRSVPPGR
jgi:peptide/nickel transport system permease protein